MALVYFGLRDTDLNAARVVDPISIKYQPVNGLKKLFDNQQYIGLYLTLYTTQNHNILGAITGDTIRAVYGFRNTKNYKFLAVSV